MASKRIKTPADEAFPIPRGVMQHIAGASAEELKTLIAFFAAPETTVAEAAREYLPNPPQSRRRSPRIHPPTAITIPQK